MWWTGLHECGSSFFQTWWDLQEHLHQYKWKMDYLQDGSGMWAVYTFFGFFEIRLTKHITLICNVVKGAILIYLILHHHTMQMFFPIVFENHWVLLCVSMFMKQIAFFDSLSDSKESKCLKCAQNLVSGFLGVSCVFWVFQVAFTFSCCTFIQPLLK